MANQTLQFWLLGLAGWVNREQQDVIEYLQEENRVYREMLGDRWLRFDDAQQRRLACRAKALGRRTLAKLGCIVTPDTLLRWYRELIARKYDGRGIFVMVSVISDPFQKPRPLNSPAPKEPFSGSGNPQLPPRTRQPGPPLPR